MKVNDRAQKSLGEVVWFHPIRLTLVRVLVCSVRTRFYKIMDVIKKNDKILIEN